MNIKYNISTSDRLSLAVAEVYLDYGLYSAKLAERLGDIFWKRKFEKKFERLARSLEEHPNISLRRIVQTYRLAMEEIN